MEVDPVKGATHHVNNLDLHINLNNQDIKAGDFVTIKFNNIGASKKYFNNREIRINDEIVGIMKFSNSSKIGDGMPFPQWPLGTGLYSYEYKLVFNDNIDKYKDQQISIKSKNLFGYQAKTTKPYDLAQSVEINGKVIVSETSKVNPIGKPLIMCLMLILVKYG